MSEEPGLLAAICDAPGDDLPRLVYADWLDENGHGLQAEFIRTQCQRAQTRENDPHFLPLLMRERELLEQFARGQDIQDYIARPDSSTHRHYQAAHENSIWDFCHYANEDVHNSGDVLAKLYFRSLFQRIHTPLNLTQDQKSHYAHVVSTLKPFFDKHSPVPHVWELPGTGKIIPLDCISRGFVDRIYILCGNEPMRGNRFTLDEYEARCGNLPINELSVMPYYPEETENVPARFTADFDRLLRLPGYKGVAKLNIDSYCTPEMLTLLAQSPKSKKLTKLFIEDNIVLHQNSRVNRAERFAQMLVDIAENPHFAGVKQLEIGYAEELVAPNQITVRPANRERVTALLQRFARSPVGQQLEQAAFPRAIARIIADLQHHDPAFMPQLKRLNEQNIADWHPQTDVTVTALDASSRAASQQQASG